MDARGNCKRLTDLLKGITRDKHEGTNFLVYVGGLERYLIARLTRCTAPPLGGRVRCLPVPGVGKLCKWHAMGKSISTLFTLEVRWINAPDRLERSPC